MPSSSRNQRPQLNCNHPHYFTPPIANLGRTNLHLHSFTFIYTHLHSFTFICTHLHLHKPHIHAPIRETLMPDFGLFLALYTFTLIFYFQSPPKAISSKLFQEFPKPKAYKPPKPNPIGISTMGTTPCILYI